MSLADHDRPLNERGRLAGKFMGHFIAEHGLIPDMILCSSARRTQETLDLVLPFGDNKCSFTIDDRIYEASPNTLIYVLAEYADSADSILLIGHNPGIEGLIHIFTGQNERMPTAALAIIEFDTDGNEKTSPDTGKLINVFRPKELM